MKLIFYMRRERSIPALKYWKIFHINIREIFSYLQFTTYGTSPYIASSVITIIYYSAHLTSLLLQDYYFILRFLSSLEIFFKFWSVFQKYHHESNIILKIKVAFLSNKILSFSPICFTQIYLPNHHLHIYCIKRQISN